MNRDLIFAKPARVFSIPMRNASVGDDYQVRGVSQHCQRILDGFLRPAVNGNGFPLDTAPVAIFAKEHAVSQTRSHVRDVGRNVENSRGQKQTRTTIRALLSA